MTIHDISKSTVGLQHESFFVQAFWQLFYLKKKKTKLKNLEVLMRHELHTLLLDQSSLSLPLRLSRLVL